jgi:predicted outer membrane repeat protein
MLFRSVFSFGETGCPRRRHPLSAPSRQRGFRPFLVALEDRCVPSTLNVTSNADNGASGSLRWAVTHAKAGDTIDILTSQTIALTQGELYLNKNLTIEAPTGSLATISGNHQSRVFEVAAGAVNLDNLIITGGNGLSVHPRNSNGWDRNGGGILNETQLAITNCTVGGNSAENNGGGILNLGQLTVNGSTLSDNSAGLHGGGVNNDGVLTINNSTLSGNSAVEQGGGIHGGGDLTLNGCILSGNAASWGGGIFAEGQPPSKKIRGRLTPARISHVTISDCTLSNNSASFGGGAIGIGLWCTAHVGGSSFSANSPDNIFGPYIDDGGNTGL